MIKEDATISWYAFRFRTFNIPKDAFTIEKQENLLVCTKCQATCLRLERSHDFVLTERDF